MAFYRHPSGRSIYVEDIQLNNHVPTHARLSVPLPGSKPSCPGLTPAAPLASHAAPGEFSIRSIPDVMRWKLGWPVAARVMEKWFALPAREMLPREKSGELKPTTMPADYVDTELIRWHWLNQFSRVAEAEQSLHSRLVNSAAMEELENKFHAQLIANARLREQSSRGSVLIRCRDVIEAHSLWQFQLADVLYGRPRDMDDLYGALGRFTVYAAVNIGQVQSLGSNRYRLSVSEIAVYVRDTYEFIDSQYLGHWNFAGLGFNPTAAVNGLGIFGDNRREWRLWGFSIRHGFMQPVNNSDYRHYQRTHGRGGDYLLFSDIKRVPVNISVEVTL
ncbi:DUF6402 family protein [Nitrincola sp. MINF-07-Sa-05]|uniref:DUF6402 family protein n=1 Tax=Nitrincola salilacus TaxID=3400273 RepID=UPI0039185A84